MAKRAQKSEIGTGTPFDLSYLPVIDGHCHVFGQALFEGGDLVDFLDFVDFVAYVQNREKTNANLVLEGIPAIEGLNKNNDGAVARAAVPLLLDMGYTPLTSVGIISATNAEPRALSTSTENEQIARNDLTRSQADRSAKITLRLDGLYCYDTEDYTGDDEIRVEIYEDNKLIQTLPMIVVDHDNQTRMINREILFDKDSQSYSVKLLERDIDSPDDNLGYVTRSLSSSGQDTLKFQGYDLNVEITPPEEAAEKSAPPEGAKGQWILSIETLECVEQEDWTGDDDIRIEVSSDGGSPEKLSSIAADTGKSYGVDQRFTFQSSAVIKLWEEDIEGDDDLGSWSVEAKEVTRQTAAFTQDGAHYKLSYSVAPGYELKDDGYYLRDEDYLWFKRDAESFRGTIRALSKAAALTPGCLFPLAPFDPRRPDGLDFIKEAVDQLGFVGVKTYTRCGWLPMNNRELYGDTLGQKIDDRLKALYDYLCDRDLPILNHTSPTGYPPNPVMVYPAAYHKIRTAQDVPTQKVQGPGFPPLWTTGGLPEKVSGYDLGAASKAAVAKTAAYYHYVQKTVSPYAWQPVFDTWPALRLDFGHNGSEIAIGFRYPQETAGILKEEALAENGFVDKGANLKKHFIAHAIALCSRTRHYDYEGRPTFYSEKERQTAIEKVLADPEWGAWFNLWASAYPDSWLNQIISMEAAYENVYSDISYLSGGEEEDFIGLFNPLAKDAQEDTHGGRVMARKHFIGTDWYMIAMDDMSPADFWARSKKGMEKGLGVGDAWQHSLWRSWASENCLRWLNLESQKDTLEAFYKKAGGDLPFWWKNLSRIYKSLEAKPH